MPDETLESSFDLIYSTDLVYVPDCWKLCGDAHCCSFSRYKSQFKLMRKTPSGELPLLPGEYEYLDSKGWLEQFQDFEHNVVEFEIDSGVIKMESIISQRPNCACDHGTRPTICRLYPLVPEFSIDGRVKGTLPAGIYEELELIDGLEPACKLESLPFDQLDGFLTLTHELGKWPLFLFYLEAYRIAKKHVADRISQQCSESGKSALACFEFGFLRRQLVDRDKLREQLSRLAEKFKEYYGDQFSLT